MARTDRKLADRIAKACQSGAEPERRGKASKPETMRPFARWKSSGERSQSVHSTEALPMQNRLAERGRESKARSREGNAGGQMRLKAAWGVFDGDGIGKPTDVSCRVTGSLMWTAAMKGAVGPLRRANRKDVFLYHLNLFSHGD